MYRRASAFRWPAPPKGQLPFPIGFPASCWLLAYAARRFACLAVPFAFLAGCLLCLALSFWLPAYVLSSALAGFDTEQLQSKRCATSNLRSRLLMNGLQQIYHTASANSP